MPAPSGLTSTLFDMQSVDVLKGPQGTLVGRNSTGGAILFQSQDPTDTISAAISRRRAAITPSMACRAPSISR